MRARRCSAILLRFLGRVIAACREQQHAVDDGCAPIIITAATVLLRSGSLGALSGAQVKMESLQVRS